MGRVSLAATSQKALNKRLALQRLRNGAGLSMCALADGLDGVGKPRNITDEMKTWARAHTHTSQRQMLPPADVLLRTFHYRHYL